MKVGTRIEIHPATALWMRGARFGTVVKVTRTKVHVDVDKTGRVHRFHPDNVKEVD
jgi:hypothetical protein